MKKYTISMSLMLFALIFVIAVSQAFAGFTISNYSLVNRKRVSRTDYLYTFKANITNTGESGGIVTATLTSDSSTTLVVDKDLEFGKVPAGETVTSETSFSIRQNRKYGFNEDALKWRFSLKKSAKKAIVIGVDGLVYKYVDSEDDPEINEPDTPNFNRLTLSKAHVGGLLNTGSVQATSSSPGWTSILTGTWVDQHKISANGYSATAAPSIFERLYNRNNSIHTASYVHWSTINSGQLQNELPLMETHVEGVDDDTVTENAVAELEKESSDIDFIFVQLDEVDGAGHDCGWNACYEQAVSAADRQLGKILDAVETREALYNEEWLVIMVSDHGHKPQGGHGGQTLEERTSVLGVNRPGLMNELFFSPADPLSLTNDDAQNALMGYPAVTSIVPTVMEYMGYPATEDDRFEGTTLLKNLGLGAHKLYATVSTVSGDFTKATVKVNWQAGDDTASTTLFRDGEKLLQLLPGQTSYEETFDAAEIGPGAFDVSYMVVADNGTPVSTLASGEIGVLPDIADIMTKSSMVLSFDDGLSPFSWVAGTQSGATFEDGPFEGSNSLQTERSKGYATLDKDISELTKFAFGFWFKVNGDVSSDPNIISNKNWDHGYYKGFTVAIKSSGIKLNIGDGINRADTPYIPYTKNQWIYVAAAMDLENQTMTLYISDPGNGFQSSTVSTGNVSSLGSGYPLNIGEGGDGDYNVGRSLNFNMADLIILEQQDVSQLDIHALAGAKKPLNEYMDTAPEVSEIINDALMTLSFNGSLSPFSWVAGTQSGATFEDGPFEGVKALKGERNLGYATFDQDITGVTDISFGFRLKINGSVSGDPNIISNKDWDHGYYKGFTVAVKSSGIKLNIGDGINRADTPYIPYTKNEWIYVAVSIDLDNKTMTLYVLDPEKGLESSTVSTGDVSSLASDYPVNIGEGGDGDYNVGRTFDFNMSDLIVTLDNKLTVFDVKALANADKPLSAY